MTTEEHAHDTADPACAMAHGELPVPTGDRRLVLVFDAPVARELAHFAPHLGWSVELLEPRDGRLPAVDEHTDVVVCDHDRPELGEVLRGVLAQPTRWVGVMGSLRHSAPHVEALRALGVPEADVARVHRPIGLDLGSRSPAEIALATLAGLLADRNGKPGGPYPSGG